MHPFKPILITIFLCIVYNAVFSQNFTRREIGIQNDNDVYLMTFQDQYYTNGINFYFRKAIDSSKYPQKYANKLWTINIGHKIFNAYNGAVEAASEVDRPLTGYLYVRGELQWHTKKEEVLSVAAEIASIGNWAFGEKLQTNFHRLFGFYDISGWEYELSNSTGVDLKAGYAKLLVRNKAKSVDALINGNLSLGFNNTRLSVSPNFRLGRLNSLNESAIMGSRPQSRTKKVDNEFYFYYRPQINLVLYNSTIQGGLFLDDKGPITYGVKPWVLSQIVGLQFATERMGVNFNYTFNTKEVKSLATSHKFGSVNLSFYF